MRSLLALLLFVSQISNAQTIILARAFDNSIYLAADSKLSGSGDAAFGCKIWRVDSVYYALSGLYYGPNGVNMILPRFPGHFVSVG